MITTVERIILEATCSKSLLNAIKKANRKFEDFDLLILAYRYARTHDKQMELFRLISENTKDERTKIQAEECISYKQSEYAKFVSNENDCVFEVVITNSHEKWQVVHESRFLAKTYQVALDKIKDSIKSYKEYVSEVPEISQIEILKRKVFNNVTDEDERGRARYNESLELIDIDHYEYDDECTWLSPNCKCYHNDNETVDNECFLHREIGLPKFIKDMDLITYKSYHDTLGTSEYAINIDWDDDDGTDTLKTGQNLCIPLDDKSYTGKTKDKLLDHHTHIEYVHIDTIEPNELPENIQKIYSAVAKVLLKGKEK